MVAAYAWVGLMTLIVMTPLILYPLAILLMASVARRQRVSDVGNGVIGPCSVILVVKNEEQHILRRLRNLALQRPAGIVDDILVVDDGSTDRTIELVRERQQSDPRIRLIAHGAEGKATGVRAGVHAAKNDWLVFCDARQLFSRNAVEAFSRAIRAGASLAGGHLVYTGERESWMQQSPLIWYWRFERTLRAAEADLGMLLGVAGAGYAARRSEFPDIPAGTILDDMFVPMTLALQGKRCSYVKQAVIFDQVSSSASREQSRKRRTLAGNLQLLRLLPGLLRFWNGRIHCAFFFHKLSRLLLPLLLVVWTASVLLVLFSFSQVSFTVFAAALVSLTVVLFLLRLMVPAVGVFMAAIWGALSSYAVWWKGSEADVWVKESDGGNGSSSPHHH